MENIKLKPCPFCGRQAQMRTSYSELSEMDYSYVICMRCGARGTTYASKRIDDIPGAKVRAAMAWNTRYREKEG